MTEKKYYLMVKTGNAEFRAWRQFAGDSASTSVVPIIELTRGKKKIFSKSFLNETQNSELSQLYENREKNPSPYLKKLLETEKIYNFDMNLESVIIDFSSSPELVLDVTQETSLACYETEHLLKPENGYQNWTQFVENLKVRCNNLAPCILVNPGQSQDKTQYEKDLVQQFEKLAGVFNNLYYRIPITIDDEFKFDLEILANRIREFSENGGRFQILLDHEQVKPGTGILHAARTLGYMEEIRKLLPTANFISLATSFPKVISEVGDQFEGRFPIEEVTLHSELIKQDESFQISYGDYGSINPIRNDLILRGGWHARIVYPTTTQSHYLGEKNQNPKDYNFHYQRVAERLLQKPDIAIDNLSSWGVSEIQKAAKGNVTQRVPSFWISVRMEIHIQQQLRRLGLSENQ